MCVLRCCGRLRDSKVWRRATYLPVLCGVKWYCGKRKKPYHTSLAISAITNRTTAKSKNQTETGFLIPESKLFSILSNQGIARQACMWARIYHHSPFTHISVGHDGMSMGATNTNQAIRKHRILCGQHLLGLRWCSCTLRIGIQ